MCWECAAPLLLCEHLESGPIWAMRVTSPWRSTTAPCSCKEGVRHETSKPGPIKGLDRRSLWGTELSHPENKSTCQYETSAIPPGITALNILLEDH
jgi:hypothetical protein